MGDQGELGAAPGMPLETIDEDLSKSWGRGQELAQDLSKSWRGGSQGSGSEHEGANTGPRALSPLSPDVHGYEEEDPLNMTMKLPQGQSWMSYALEESTRLRIEKGTHREAGVGAWAVQEDSGGEEGMDDQEGEGPEGLAQFCAMMLERRLPALTCRILARIRAAAPAGQAAQPRSEARGGGSRAAAGAQGQPEAHLCPVGRGVGARPAGDGGRLGRLKFPKDDASVDDFLDGIHRQLSDDESRRRQKNTEALEALDDSLKQLSSARDKLSSSPNPMHAASPATSTRRVPGEEEPGRQARMPNEQAAGAASTDALDDSQGEGEDAVPRRALLSPPHVAYTPLVSPPQLVLEPGPKAEASGSRRTLMMPPLETGSLHGILAELPVEPGSDESGGTDNGDESDGDEKVGEGEHSSDGGFVSDGGHAYTRHDVDGDVIGEEAYYYESEGGGVYVEGHGRVEESGEEDEGDAYEEQGGAVYLDDDELEEGVYESDGGGVYIVGAGQGLETFSEEGSFEEQEGVHSPGSGAADSNEEYEDVEGSGGEARLGSSVGGIGRIDERRMDVGVAEGHAYATGSGEEDEGDAYAEQGGVVYLDDDDLEEGVYESDGGGVYIVGAGRGLETFSEEGSFEEQEGVHSPGSGAADVEDADVESPGVNTHRDREELTEARKGRGEGVRHDARRRVEERDAPQSEEVDGVESEEEELPYVHGAYKSDEDGLYMSDGGTIYMRGGGGEADDESYIVGSGEESYNRSGEDQEERNSDLDEEDVEEEVHESDGGSLYLLTVRRSKRSVAQDAGRGGPIDDDYGDGQPISPGNKSSDEYESAGGATHVLWKRGSKESSSRDEEYGSQSPRHGESDNYSDIRRNSADLSSHARTDGEVVPSESLVRPSAASTKAAARGSSDGFSEQGPAASRSSTATPLGSSKEAHKDAGRGGGQRGGIEEGIEYESAGGGRHTMWDGSGSTQSSAEAHGSTSPPPSESNANSDVKKGPADARKYVDLRRGASARGPAAKTSPEPKRAHATMPRTSPPADLKRSPLSSKRVAAAASKDHSAVINDHRRDVKKKPLRRAPAHSTQGHASPQAGERRRQGAQRAVAGLRESTPDSLDGDDGDGHMEGDFAPDGARTPDSLEAGADRWVVERDEEGCSEVYVEADDGSRGDGAFDRTPSAVSFDLTPDVHTPHIAAYRSARAGRAEGRLATKESGRSSGNVRAPQAFADTIRRRDHNRPAQRGAAGTSPVRGARVASPPTSSARATSPPARVDARATEAFLIASRAPRRASGRFGATNASAAPLRGTRGSPPEARSAAVPSRRAGPTARGAQELVEERRPAPKRPKSAPSSGVGRLSGSATVAPARAIARRRAWG